MPNPRLVRRLTPFAAAAALLGLAGCVAPPPPYAVGQVAISNQCAAGFYQCVLPASGPVGAPCACPGIGAPSYGSIR